MKNYNKFISLNKNHFSIFLFHGVIKKKINNIRNYNNKHLLEKKFIYFLNILKSKGTILSLDEIYFNIRNKINLPKNCYAVTFDDGFENNYSIAAPILLDLKIPTTFYLSTDFIENNSISWIDKIEFCLENVDSGSINLPELDRVIHFFDKTSKIKLLKIIRNKIKKNFKIDLKNFVSEFFDQLNFNMINKLDTPIDLKLNWKQVKEMNNNQLFTIGGHGHNHLSFGSLNNSELKSQITQSLKLFKKKINKNLIHYSYPEGQKIDYNDFVINFLIKNGIKICPSAISGINNIHSDFFNLKRIQFT